MKNYTEEQILKEIDSLKNSIKNDWSKWGDISESTRKEAINRLNKIKRMFKSPRKINFTLQVKRRREQ